MDEQPLRKYYDFDDADLAANRSGRLTQKQVMKLKSDKKWGKIGGIGCGLFFFAIASIFPIAFTPIILLSYNKGDIGGMLGAGIGTLVWVLAWGGIGLYLLISSLRTSDTKILLKSVSGPINIVGVEKRSGGEHPHNYTDYELHIQDQTFNVERAFGGYMVQGDVYTVYFIEDLNGDNEQVLSLEKVS
jgi:hypothetical protein